MKAINIIWDITDGAEDMTQEEINVFWNLCQLKLIFPKE